jgi:hypothetical protein
MMKLVFEGKPLWDEKAIRTEMCPGSCGEVAEELKKHCKYHV